MANLEHKLRKLRADATLTGFQMVQEGHRLIGQLQWERSKQAAVTIADEANRLAGEQEDLRKWLEDKNVEIRQFYRLDHNHWYRAWWLNPLKWFKAAKMAKLRLLCTYIAAHDFVGSESSLDCISRVDYDDYRHKPIAKVIFSLSRLFESWWDALVSRVDRRIKDVGKLKSKERLKLCKEVDRKKSIFYRNGSKKAEITAVDVAHTEEGKLTDALEKISDLEKERDAQDAAVAAERKEIVESQKRFVKGIGLTILENNPVEFTIITAESEEVRKKWLALFEEGASLEQCVSFSKKHISPIFAKKVSISAGINARKKELEPVITKLRTMIYVMSFAKSKGWSTPLKLASMMVKHDDLAAEHGLTWRRGTYEYDYNPIHDVKILQQCRPDLFSERARRDSGFVSDQPCRDDFRLDKGYR